MEILKYFIVHTTRNNSLFLNELRIIHICYSQNSYDRNPCFRIYYYTCTGKYDTGKSIWKHIKKYKNKHIIVNLSCSNSNANLNTIDRKDIERTEITAQNH